MENGELEMKMGDMKTCLKMELKRNCISLAPSFFNKHLKTIRGNFSAWKLESNLGEECFVLLLVQLPHEAIKKLFSQEHANLGFWNATTTVFGRPCGGGFRHNGGGNADVQSHERKKEKHCSSLSP
ncbi:hypothetical protein PIB30_018237 [Stylosanthes scabra]|uniref:Uncharacterized protein n=1 Tax=Stylosanthes scabra TaxID=79078 RepID=A0ABU6VA92_9FABA|nr:hypothetical protein [Stylosanthes scabra]